MVGDGNGNGRSFEPLLHDDVAAALTDFDKTIARENTANLASGKNA